MFYGLLWASMGHIDHIRVATCNNPTFATELQRDSYGIFVVFHRKYLWNWPGCLMAPTGYPVDNSWKSKISVWITCG